MKTMIRGAAAAGLVAALAVLTGCSAGAPSSDTTEAAGGDGAKPVLRVSGVDPATKELFDESHIWDDAPYTIEASALRFSDAAAALQSGQIDLGYFAATTAILLQANGGQDWTQETAPIVSIAGYAPPRSVGAIIVKSDSGIDSVADLKGKTITWNAGDNGLWLQALEDAGLTKDDVENVQSNDSASVFRAGSADALSGAVSQVADLIADGEAKILVTSGQEDIAFYPQWAVRRADLDDPDQEALIKDFLVRYTEWNTKWYWENTDTVRDVLKNVGQQSDASIDYTLKWQKGVTVIAYDDTLFKAVQNTVDRFTELGLISGGIKDVSATFDSRYAELLGATPYSFTDAPV